MNWNELLKPKHVPLTLEQFKSRLENVGNSDGIVFFASCPNASAHKHGDRRQSFHFREGENGKILFNCKTCGEYAKPEILRAMGLTFADLCGSGYGGGWTPKGSKPARKKEAPSVNFQQILDHATHFQSEVNAYAHRLGVSPQSLQRLGVGYDPAPFYTGKQEPVYTAPERNPDGSTCGIHLRGLSGGKFTVKGGHRGLCFANDWRKNPESAVYDPSEPIISDEGFTSTAALMTMGICTVGRSSNSTGAEILAEFYAPWIHADLILMGQNDRDGDAWPGRTGPISTAEKIAKILGRPVYVSMTPQGLLPFLPKDTRDICKQIIYSRDILEQGQRLKAAIVAGAEKIGAEYITVPTEIVDIQSQDSTQNQCGHGDMCECESHTSPEIPYTTTWDKKNDENKVWSENWWEKPFPPPREEPNQSPANPTQDVRAVRSNPSPCPKLPDTQNYCDNPRCFIGKLENKSQMGFFRSGCRKRSCPQCVNYERSEYFDEMIGHIINSQEIFYGEIDNSAWGATRKDLNRQDILYQRTVFTNGKCGIFTNKPYKTFQRMHAPAKAFHDAIYKSDPTVRNMFSASREWDRIEKIKEKVFEWVKPLPKNVRRIEKSVIILNRALPGDIKYDVLHGKAMEHSCVVSYPPDTPPEHVKMIVAWIMMQEELPEWRFPTLWEMFSKAIPH